MKILDRFPLITLFVISLLLRLAFLGEGYGKEFDAWSNALNAKTIAETGIYEVSRLPGHPIYESILAALWPLNHSYFFFNLLSALISSAAVVLIFAIAKELKLKQAFYWSLAFGFIPVFFIAGTYTIDYNFALFFILTAFLALLRRQYWWLGIALGLATGFRISSLGFLLPFTLWLGFKDFRSLIKMYFAAGLVSLLVFTPPLLTYGLSFLDFHKPPFPGWANVIYKVSIGIWGLPLSLFLIWQLSKIRSLKLTINWPDHLQGLSFHWGVIVILALQAAVFMRLPFKSEFFLAALPFIWFLFAGLAQDGQERFFLYAGMGSLLFFGLDYDNIYRGATPGKAVLRFEANGKSIFLSPFQGPLSLDQSKRRNKSITVEESMKVLAVSESSWLIAGWYWPELVLKLGDTDHLIDHYSTKQEILKAQEAGYPILYLPEINEQNQIIHQHPLADSLAKPLLSP